MHHVRRATDGPNWNSFAPITPNDHAGYIWIAALFGITMSLLVAATRIWIKKDAFGLDDTLFVAATVSLGHAVDRYVTAADRCKGCNVGTCDRSDR